MRVDKYIVLPLACTYIYIYIYVIWENKTEVASSVSAWFKAWEILTYSGVFLITVLLKEPREQPHSSVDVCEEQTGCHNKCSCLRPKMASVVQGFCVQMFFLLLLKCQFWRNGENLEQIQLLSPGIFENPCNFWNSPRTDKGRMLVIHCYFENNLWVIISMFSLFPFPFQAVKPILALQAAQAVFQHLKSICRLLEARDLLFLASKQSNFSWILLVQR